jgi:hypothetical protein
MAVTVYTRVEMLALVERLANRAKSPLLSDMPETQRDIRAAAMILSTLLSLGVGLDNICIEEIVRDRPPCTPTEH